MRTVIMRKVLMRTVIMRKDLMRKVPMRKVLMRKVPMRKVLMRKVLTCESPKRLNIEIPNKKCSNQISPKQESL